MSPEQPYIPVNPELLPELLETHLPTRRTVALSLSELLDPARKLRRASQGCWLVHSTPTLISDDTGWFIIHWPSLVRGIFSSMRGKGLLTNWGYSELIYAQLHTRSPEGFDTQWRLFKAYFEQEMLPPSARLWSENNNFQRLTKFVVDLEESYEDNFTIFRAGEFLNPTNRTLVQRVAAYDAFRKLPYIDPTRVLDKTPQPFRLLYWALRRAKATDVEDGFNSWGLAWTRKGLLFHYGRALARARQDLLIADMFGGDLYNNYLGPWSQEYVLNSTGSLRLPPLAKFAYRLSLVEYEKATEPYHLTKDEKTWSDLNRVDSKYIPENHLFFPFKGGKIYDIRSYINELVEISTNEDAYANAQRNRTRRKRAKDVEGSFSEAYGQKKRGKPPSAASLAKKKKKAEAAAGKPTATRERVVSIMTVDERQLGYEVPSNDPDNPDAVEGLAIRALKYCGETYIAYPDVISQYYPTINQAKWFDRRSLHQKKKWVNPSTNAVSDVIFDRTLLGNKNIAATVRYRDILYFHPALMVPDGEAMGFLREVYRLQGLTEPRIIQMTLAFSNFLHWVHSPAELLEGHGMFGAELESLIDPTLLCPIKLNSPQERLDFFFQKGMHAKRRGLAYSGNPGTHGQRSTRMQIYDKWVVWYASTTELPYLGYQLNNQDQAEYLTKRWLTWRRPSSLKTHLWKGTYGGERKRQPMRPKDITVDQLVEQAAEIFGPSFTSY